MNEHEVKKERRKSRHGLWAGIALGGILGTLLAGGLFFSNAKAKAAGQWFAGAAHGHQRFGPLDPEVMRERTDFAVEWVLGRVDANDAQKQDVKNILSTTINGLLPLGEQHRENREAFATEFAKATIDRAAIEEIRKAELELADQASSRLVTTFADVAEVLTPEQRTELLEWAQKFHE